MSPALTVWFTGLSGSGKTTLCNRVAGRLRAAETNVKILDGDELRKGLCSDLGFSVPERCENIRRIMCAANIVASCGITVLVATISPLQSMRDAVREGIGSLLEVFVDAPLHICEARDPKGLYRRARRNELPGFTGIASSYERPVSPDIICYTDRESINESAKKVVDAISAWYIKTDKNRQPCGSIDTEALPTIAVDFDGVIAEYNGWRGPDILGAPRDDVIKALITLKAEGWKIIIHTTRKAVDILDYLKDASIPFDEINKSSASCLVSSKPRATVYWDDRALKYSGDAKRDLEVIRTFRTWNGRR